MKSSDHRSQGDRLLIHPISALLLIAIDNLWTLADWAALAWPVTIPVSFVATAVPAFLVQKFFKKDSSGKALAVSSFLGVLAAVPTPITGTVIGAVALGFAGFSHFRTKQ